MVLILEHLLNIIKLEFINNISILSVVLGIIVILSKNPIKSLLCLIALFGAIAIYLMCLDFVYIGISYLIIYIGAISILFIFIIMLLDIRTSELTNNNWNSLSLGSFFLVLFVYIMYINIGFNTNISIDVFFSSTNSWMSQIVYIGHISSIGNVLYTVYNMWIVLSSFILVLSMVGCITITMK